MATDWNAIFSGRFLLNLTDEERHHLALSPMDSAWEALVFHSKTNLWYKKLTVFFDGDTIVKVNHETKKIWKDGLLYEQSYTEYDTNLATENRKWILPLTACGKPKPLNPTNINAVSPFGCMLYILFRKDRDTTISLENLRGNKKFPLGQQGP